MPICPSCGSGFRAGFSECNTCHVPLVDSLDEPEVEAIVEAGDGANTLHLLGTMTEDAQAILLRRLLDEAEIPSILQGGHGLQIGQCVPFRILIDEDYFEAARETIAAYQSPALLTGQIEGDLGRLSSELNRLKRERQDLAPKLQALQQSVDQLRQQLEALNRDLDE